jgi:hypothetical protein
VLEDALAALQQRTYQCAERAIPVPASDTVMRFYSMEFGGTLTTVAMVGPRSGPAERQSVHYMDQSGQRRSVTESEDRPLLAADSIVRPLFAAAAAAPCEPIDIRPSDGDGSVGWVIEGALAGLRASAYDCSASGGPFRDGDVVKGRDYRIGLPLSGTRIEILTRNGELIHQWIEYTDSAGRRRRLTEDPRRPLLGADSVARQLFAAAAAAPCPRGT